MGFDLLLIATNANGLRIPEGAKCCICLMLLDDGVGLSGCTHNACYKCMKKRSEVFDSKCPIDGKPFDMKRYYHLSDEVENWLSNIKLKCKWFDGHNCMATAISMRNAHHHRKICPNNPKNKKSSEQTKAIKFVSNWMQSDGNRGDSDTDSIEERQQSNESNGVAIGHPTRERGFSFKPNKRTVGHRFFSNEMSSDMDSDWRK